MTTPWLRSLRFDLGLTVGVAALGLAAAVAVATHPGCLPALLVFDFWLLGYPHVVATYTRLVFDRESAATYRSLVTWLPVVVVAVVVAVAFGIGTWALISTYFYWQAWHYSRQSYGMSRIYRRREGLGPSSPKPETSLARRIRAVSSLDILTEPRGLADDRLDAAVIFGLPLAGVLHRSAQGWTAFLSLPIRMIPVPADVADAAAYGALLVVTVWVMRQVGVLAHELLPRPGEARRSRSWPHTLYMLTHIVVFSVGYGLPDLSQGWLALNVWHNAQYLLIVWMYNLNRFRGGETSTAPLLSAMSQPQAVPRFLFVVYASATILFAFIAGLPGVRIQAVSLVLLFSQSLNFHHYLVDAVIWKVRKPEVARLLAGGPLGRA